MTRLALLLLFVAGCADRRAENFSSRTQLIDGVEIVTNPDTPLVTSDIGLPEWVYSDLLEPRYVVALHDRVVVGDPSSAVFHILNGRGMLATQFGRKGRGPGEFVRPTLVKRLGSAILIVDGGTARMETWSGLGERLAEHPAGSLLFAVAPVGSDRFWISGLSGNARAEFITDINGHSRSFERESLSRYVPPGIPDCWRSSAADDALLLANCQLPLVAEFDTLGSVRRVFLVDHAAASVSSEALGRAGMQIRQSVAEVGLSASAAQSVVESQLDELRLNKVVHTIRHDPISGSVFLLLQAPDLLDPSEAVLMEFDRSGFYRRQLRTDRAWVDFDVRAGWLYAITRAPSTHEARLEAFSLSP